MHRPVLLNFTAALKSANRESNEIIVRAMAAVSD